jgi:xanthine dehydrogenase YagR molybdenum-binding subunit
MSGAQEAVQAVVKKAIPLAPDSWIPGGKPDPLIHHKRMSRDTTRHALHRPDKNLGITGHSS